MRQLRNMLSHRASRTKIFTALKNRTWSEFRKRDIKFETTLSTKKGRKMAEKTGIYEVSQNLELLETVASQIKEIEA
ncbi:MAG: hypothetical protein ACK4GQ_03985 [Candidatus Hadarchaeales archaeon]